MKKIIVLCLAVFLFACNQHIDITLPSALFPDMTDDEIYEMKDLNGYENVRINDDRSVTLTMTKDKLEEIKKGIVTDLDATIEELKVEENSYIEDITYNESYNHFTLLSDGAKFDESFSIYAELSILMNAFYYHFFDGKREDAIEITFTHIDAQSKEVLKEEVYPKKNNE